MAITHEFVNPKADSADTTITRPSDWNADHIGNGVGWFNVHDYGATGDNVTDDQPAVQAAITAAGAAGGGVVWFPKGSYLLTALAISTVGSEAHLSIPYSNITLAGAGSASVIRTADNYQMTHAGIVGSANAYVLQTVYTLTGSYATGVTSVTCATPANASNFAAGDYIYIRTGQTLSSGTGNPDSEINQVVTVNGGTGVITLAWPTAKPYAREYFISGTSGVTSTSVTANLAIFGVAKITAQTITDLTYRDLRFTTTGTGGQAVALYGGQAVRVMVQNCTGSFNSGFMSFGAHRFMTVRDCNFHHPGPAPVAYYYTLTADNTCSDALWEGNSITGEHVAQMHVHEGASRVRIVGNTIVVPTDASDVNLLSIRGRAYGISVVGNTFVGTTPAVLYVDSACVGGGNISDNVFIGASGYGISIQAANWSVDDNHFENAQNGQKQYLSPYAGTNTGVRAMSAWVASNWTTAPLGLIPGNSQVIGVYLYVSQAFNSSGTDLLTVGISGTANAYATSADVSVTGYAPMTLGAYAPYGTGDNPPLINAYYVAGGTAPSTGKALVTLLYVPVAEQP